MNNTLANHCAAASIALLTFATTARGSVPVPITNAGFENPVLADGVWQATVPGWSQGQYNVTAPTVWVVGVPSNYDGVYNVSTGEYTSGTAPEGQNMGFTTSEPGFDIGLNQVLTTTLEPNAQYNLSVKVGNPFLYNGDVTANWRIELLAGGVLLQSATGSSPANDTTFTTASLTYNSGTAPAQLGQPLEIRLLAVNFTSGYEVDYDDVQLTVDSTSGYTAWQSTNGTTGAINEDHDNDGVPNGIEYFLGGPNGHTTGFTALPGVSNTGGTRSVTWTKAADYTGVYPTDFFVETSDTLTGTWTAETQAPGGNVTLDGRNVKYTFPSPLGSKKFVRLKVTGP